MPTKPDYALKARVLRSELPALARKISRAEYAAYLLQTTGEVLKGVTMTLDAASDLRRFLLQKYPVEYPEAEKIERARVVRSHRLKKRLTYMLNSCHTAVFVTLTFRDDVLASTTAETRRRYVTRFLNAQGDGVQYVANKDFGARNGREHYHAVICGEVDTAWWREHCGAVNVEYIKAPGFARKIPKKYRDLSPELLAERLKADNAARLAKYISKLTNHAIKETTRRSVIIYSRSNELWKPRELNPFDNPDCFPGRGLTGIRS